MKQLQYKFYASRDRQSTTIKPWGYRLAKQMAAEERLPITKILTDAVVLAHQLRQDGKFDFPRTN